MPDAPQPAARSIEDLNYLGGDAVMPPFSDSNIDVNSGFRQALLGKGLALRLISQLQYAQNTIAAPVSADQQVYVGQRAFTSAMLQPILTADLRQLHLKRTQFYFGGIWNWASWEPADPKAFQLWDLYLYKEFGGDRVEVKAGYISNSLDFVGLFVGGSTASGAQGVYAVLPFEVGMSFFPLTAPGLNLRINGPQHLYLKSGLQRSIDPAGGPTEVQRNHTGFRFDPKGDKLLVIEEGGYQRPATANEHQTWFRAAYMYNNTPFVNLANGKKQSGNHAAYVLMDYQLRQPSPLQPAQGLYIGGSVIQADTRFNAYNLYYEARLYQMAPFHSRPADQISLVSTYTGHSHYLTDALVAQGKTVWRDGASVTGSYTLHVCDGQVASLGLGYIRGPAITPRVGDSLTFDVNYVLFF
jgi:porin